MATIRCPHCTKSIGGDAQEGGLRLRLGIVLLDPEIGIVKGPCPHCKKIVVLTESAVIDKAITLTELIPAVRISKNLT